MTKPEYPCPECGWEGGHTYVGSPASDADVVECGSCHIEFWITWDDENPDAPTQTTVPQRPT